MLVNISCDSVETDHIYMTVAHNVCQILVIIAQRSHWSYWAWLEPHPRYSDCSDDNKLFLSQAGDGPRAEPDLIPTTSWRSYFGFTLVQRRPRVELSGDRPNLLLTLPPRAGQRVTQNLAVVIAREGGCTSHRREEHRQGAASPNTDRHRANLLTFL